MYQSPSASQPWNGYSVRVRMAPNKTSVKEFFDGYVRLYTAHHGAARAYTSLITAVGYAGVFGIWSLTREHISPRLTLLTAVLLLISLSTFALFEVFRTFLVNRSLKRFGEKLFGPADTLETQITKVQEFEAENAKEESHFNSCAITAWWITVVFGILAIVILMFSLLSSLVSLP